MLVVASHLHDGNLQKFPPHAFLDHLWHVRAWAVSLGGTAELLVMIQKNAYSWPKKYVSGDDIINRVACKPHSGIRHTVYGLASPPSTPSPRPSPRRRSSCMRACTRTRTRSASAPAVALPSGRHTAAETAAYHRATRQGATRHRTPPRERATQTPPTLTPALAASSSAAGPRRASSRPRHRSSCL